MAGGMAAMVGIVFSMISIKLMTIVESAQVVVVAAIGQQQFLQPDRIVAMAIGAHKFFVINLGIIFFSKISSLIFLAEGMYPEKVVQGAAAAVMSTAMISNRVRVVAARHTRHAARKTSHAARKVKKRMAARRGRQPAAPQPAA